MECCWPNKLIKFSDLVVSLVYNKLQAMSVWTFFLSAMLVSSVVDAASTSNALAGRVRINSGSLNPPSQRSQPSSSTSQRGDVYIAGFFPFGKLVAESRLGRGVMPAVKLAVEHINDSPDVLHNYRLHIYWIDTEVSE